MADYLEEMKATLVSPDQKQGEIHEEKQEEEAVTDAPRTDAEKKQAAYESLIDRMAKKAAEAAAEEKAAKPKKERKKRGAISVDVSSFPVEESSFPTQESSFPNQESSFL